MKDWQKKTQAEKEKLQHEKDQFDKICKEIENWQYKSITRERQYRKDIDTLQNEIA